MVVSALQLAHGRCVSFRSTGGLGRGATACYLRRENAWIEVGPRDGGAAFDHEATFVVVAPLAGDDDDGASFSLQPLGCPKHVLRCRGPTIFVECVADAARDAAFASDATFALLSRGGQCGLHTRGRGWATRVWRGIVSLQQVDGADPGAPSASLGIVVLAGLCKLPEPVALDDDAALRLDVYTAAAVDVDRLLWPQPGGQPHDCALCLGPSHLVPAYMRGHVEFGVAYGNVLAVGRHHVLGFAGLPIHNALTPRLLRRASACYRTVVWLVGDFRFNNRCVASMPMERPTDGAGVPRSEAGGEAGLDA